MQQLEPKKSIKDFTIMILLIMLIVTSITSFMLYKKYEMSAVGKENNINSTLLIEKVSSIWELATTKYFYSNVVSFKENIKINNVEIPFTEKGFLIKYDGYLKAGIDINSMEIISQDNESIKISINKSKILDHTIDEKSIYVYDEKNSVFNNISVKDVFSMLSNEKKIMEEKIIGNGFLEEADKNTRLVLENMLKSMGYKNIQIIFSGQ